MPRSLAPTTMALAAATLALAAPAAAQPTGRDPGAGVPDAIVKEVARDHERPADEVGPLLRMRRMDLDGDGRDELLVRATDGVCGPTGSCAFYVYRRDPGGAYQRLHRGAGTGFRVLAGRAGRWPDLREEARLSAALAIRTTYGYDGGRYHWTRREVIHDDSATHPVTARLERSLPSAAPRRLALSGAATSDPRIRLSAAYTACGAGAACPAPLLVFTWTVGAEPGAAERAGTAAWLRPGVCFQYAHASGPSGGERSRQVCAEGTRVTRLPGGSSRVSARFRSEPWLWDVLAQAARVEVRAPGATFTLGDDAGFALGAFAAARRELDGAPEGGG